MTTAHEKPEPASSPLLPLAKALIRPLVAAWHWTLKVEVKGWENIEAAQVLRRPIVLAAWHGHGACFFFGRMDVRLPIVTTMTSRSGDGEIAARLIEPFGGRAVRGSSSRGGAAGLLEFQRFLSSPDECGDPRVAIQLLDGPRGPRHRAKPGILMLAQKSNALIVPICAGAAPRWSAGSWDRHCLPLPFGRVVILFGEPIDLSNRDVAYEDDEGAESQAKFPAAEEGREKPFSTRELDRIMENLARRDPLCARDYEIPDAPKRERRKREGGPEPCSAPR